ncbi:MAG: hypothetical protein Q9228_005689 [Teloschistes exilis]
MSASLIVCADGGANRLEEANQRLGKSDITPDFICGDLDSLRPEVRASYEKQGVPILHDPDQYSTDLTKSLKCIRHWAEKSKVDVLDVIALGGIGGRFDQGFSQLQSLYSASRDESLLQGHMFLVNPQSICFLLPQGKNRIHTPLGPGFFGENVGIIPISRPSTISTNGLEWDVTDWYTEFGGQISTSNHIKNDFLEVDTTEQVLLTIELDTTSR